MKPQPMRTSGGTSGTSSGKRSLIAAGSAPAVSVVGHTTMAPLALIASAVTQGERAGVSLR
jgi:hypothetical protein